MKYDISNSQYAKFWESKEARNALTLLINNPEIIRMNYNFHRSQFSIDPNIIERNNEGIAPFVAKMFERHAPYMLDMRAPLGETLPRDKNVLQTYMGTVPDFSAKGYVEQAMEREYKQRMLEEYFGDDSDIIMHYADDLQTLFDEANQTLSYIGATALSTGIGKYDKGDGIKSVIYKAPIPAENFVKAGEKVWSDPSCKLLSQMQKIEQDFRDRTGYEGPMKWQIEKTQFQNVFLKNAEVIATVQDWRALNEKVNLTGMTITKDMAMQALAGTDIISPVEIVEESQTDGTRGKVKGWKTGIAVLRPSGYAGSIKQATILDAEMTRKYGSTVIAKVFAKRDLFTIMNTTLNNGNFKEWHTDLLVSAVPVLEEFLYHVIVDTTQADV